MKISLLHATRRPEAAIACQKLWMDRCENDSNVEIVTAVDYDDDESRKAFPNAVIAYGQEGACKAWNAAAEKATGDIFVIIDDDFEPCFGWNEVIRSYMANGADILHVGDKHRKDQLICHPIVSRNFYEAMGYLWHPLFKSVYCDNWFTEVAQRWGYVDATDGGKIDLGFVHANPSQGYGEEDDVARVSNSKERYNHGARMLARLQNQTILAFTVAGRTEYLQQSLASWLKTDLNLVTAVHFFIEPIDVEAIDTVIDDFAAKCPVPVIKHFNKEKLGVLRNPWHLFDHCFRIEDALFVILGEDDFLVSPDVLSFIHNAQKNLGDEKTMAVCAKWVGANSDKNLSTWHVTKEFTGNIWGTWQRQWNKYLRDTWDFDYSSGKADGTSCVPYNTKILTKNGWLSVRDLSIGDETIGFNHKTKKSEWTTIEDIVEYGYSSLYSFGTKGIQLTSTGNHRWIVSSETGENMTHTCNLSGSDRIVTSAPLENNSKLNCSVDEAAVLGWIAGDGSFLILKENGINAKVSQKKIQNIAILDDLFSRIPHTRTIYKDVVQWRLPTPYARDLLARVGNPKKEAFSQVLKMSEEQREAWLNAMLLAEGSPHGNSYRIYQNRGDIEEAVRFAIFASGRRPQTHILTGKPQWKECVAINSSKPIIGIGERVFIGSAPVWCVKTKLGTWTARQGDQVFLTGNSGWDHNIGLRVMPKNDLHCIVPTASRSKHIGVTGVHCHEDVFGDTVAWNFLEEPYSGSYQEMTGVVRSNKSYDIPINVTTAGDIGDVVVALASIHHGGHKATLLLRDAGGTKGITDKIGFIKPLLMAQPYIEDVRLFNGEAVNWPAEGFRGGWVRDDYTLAMNHAEHALHCGIISTLPDLSQRWLFNIEPNKAFAGKVIINRSPRYNNPHFPWRKIVEFYGVRILFIGLKHEHEAFCNAYGHVAYQPVNDLLEVAQIIAGSFLFIGNQSSCMTIAEGMKHPRILEGSLSIPDCVYPGATNAQYVFDGGVELPTVDGQASLKIDAQAVTWKNYLMPNVVPDLGKGRIGWHFEFNGSVHSDGLMEFAVKKLKKLSGWDDEKCMREIVQYTVAMNPTWFSKRVKIPQFDAPKRALRNAGYIDHTLLG